MFGGCTGRMKTEKIGTLESGKYNELGRSRWRRVLQLGACVGEGTLKSAIGSGRVAIGGFY